MHIKSTHIIITIFIKFYLFYLKLKSKLHKKWMNPLPLKTKQRQQLVKLFRNKLDIT